MKIKWSMVCPRGEAMHVATVRFARSKAEAEHCHDFYECFVVRGGAGRQYLEGSWRPLSYGQLYGLRPEHTHNFEGTADAPLEIMNVAFAAESFERLLSIEMPGSGLWEKEPEPRALQLSRNQVEGFGQLAETAASGLRDSVDLMAFYAAMLKLLRSVEPDQVTPLPEWLSTALPQVLLPENLRVGLPALLRICGRSREHVSRTFKECFGVTPTDWLLRERVRYAQSLLMTSLLPVIDISDACGFASLSYFHKCFRKHTEQTPLQYRKRQTAVQPIRESEYPPVP